MGRTSWGCGGFCGAWRRESHVPPAARSFELKRDAQLRSQIITSRRRAAFASGKHLQPLHIQRTAWPIVQQLTCQSAAA